MSPVLLMKRPNLVAGVVRTFTDEHGEEKTDIV